MAQRRSGLGRGLGALIPTDLAGGARTGDLVELPISSVEPNRFQPREVFDEESLLSLSASIRELGVLQPILVRPLDDERFELIAGERRWRAARRAGLSSIPAIVREIDDTASLEQALVENLHRADLGALEEASAYQQLMEDFGFTQEQVATRVGKSRSAVANTLRLLQLPPSVQRLLADGRLSAGHARALLGCPDRARIESLALQVVGEGWNVRQVEEAVRREPSSTRTEQALLPTSALVDPEGDAGSAGPGIQNMRSDTDSRSPAPGSGATERPGNPAHGLTTSDSPGRPAVDAALPPAGLVELEQVLGDYFETRVQVAAARGRGRITIEFADLEDLERIYRLIVHES